MAFEGIAPDRFDIIGAAIALAGVAIIFYMPRKKRRRGSRVVEEVTQAPVTLVLFFVAAIAEIGGGYLMWQWLREKKTIALGALGYNPLRLRDNSDNTASRVWKGVCCIWWDIHIIINHLGENS